MREFIDDTVHFNLLQINFVKLRDKKADRVVRSVQNFEKCRYYLLNPRLLKEVERIRDKYGIPMDGFTKLSDLIKWYKTTFKDKRSLFAEYVKEAQSLPGIVKETSAWRQFFESFLLFDEINVFCLPPAVNVDIKTDPHTNELEVILSSQGPVSKTDYLEAMDLAMKFSEEAFGKEKIRKSDNFGRDAAIYRMHLEGKTSEEIAEKFRDELTNGEPMTYPNVLKIIERVKAKTSR